MVRSDDSVLIVGQPEVIHGPVRVAAAAFHAVRIPACSIDAFHCRAHAVWLPCRWFASGSVGEVPQSPVTILGCPVRSFLRSPRAAFGCLDYSTSGIGHCFGAISAPCALRGLCFASRLRFAVPQRISRLSQEQLTEILRTHRKKRPLGLGAEPLASGAPIHRAERI
jgi:hypothetical protein